MIDDRLKTVVDALVEWCAKHHVMFDWACDESDLQGVMLFRKDISKLSELMAELAPTIQEQGIHAQIRKVRGGNIIAFSIKAISESIMDRIITDAGIKVMGLTFAEKIQRAFSITIPDPEPAKTEPINLYISARKIAEAQYKHATAGSFRNNQSSRQRQAYTSDTTFGGREHPSSPKAKSKGKKFHKSLQEALDGIATPSGNQPKDLFAKFGKALSTLGTQLGIGPLQERLKEQGIQWKQSDDGQSIIFFIVNATTNAPQPIMKINSETLDEPHDFEKELTNMLDFAKGDAPGAFQQKQEQIRQQEKVVRDIAQAVTPKEQEQTEIQKSLAPEEDAATIATSPKSSLAIANDHLSV